MAECLNDLDLQSLWQCEISEEEEKYINDQIVPLNCMVRECYLKYLRQTLIKNLSMCPDSCNTFSSHDVDKCAGFLELKALRLCMVTNLYQKAMLKIVSDIKKHTKEVRLYYKLQEVLQKNCSCKISKSKATQTNVLELKTEDQENKFDNVSCVRVKTELLESDFASDNIDASQNLSNGSIFKDSNMLENSSMIKLDECGTIYTKDLGTAKETNNKFREHTALNEKTKRVCMSSDVTQNVQSSIEGIVDKGEEAVKQLKLYLNEGSNSADFEKVLLYDSGTQELIKILESDDENIEENTYEEKKTGESPCMESVNDTSEVFWKTQRELQKKKLHDRLCKICNDPIAKVKMKNKFVDIFGYDSEEDDVWCSKEKIAKYKQRIAPLVVRHLIPYYRQKRILGRQVFKYVASHVTDKLISIHHYPEESDVEKGITLFFSYHGLIGKSEDVWPDWDQELHKVKSYRN